MVNSLWVCQARLISGMSPTPQPSGGYKGLVPGWGSTASPPATSSHSFIPGITSGSRHVPPVHREEPGQSQLQRCFCLHPQRQRIQPLPAPCTPCWTLWGHPCLWKVPWRVWKQEPPWSWWLPEDLRGWERWCLLRTCRFWCWHWDLLWVWRGSCWSLWVWGWPWIPCCPSWGYP